MKTRMKFASWFGVALAGLCVQPVAVAVSAQQTLPISVDSVSNHVRTHPKSQKAPVNAAVARTSAKPAKAKREVPSIIMMPAAQSKVTQSNAKYAAPAASADSTPAVRRAPTKAKPPR